MPDEDDRPAADPLIEAREVTRTYGGVAVLRSASAAFPPGLTAVIGPNGSGKSTLLGTLVGRVLPVEGAVLRRGPAAGARIGYLPQDVPFRDDFTAKETLAFYARLADAGPGAADDALASVGLVDAGDRRIDALSGGMRRLLGIAVATLGEPPVVVLDEPTSGLDPGMRERAFAAAADRADGGTAVVVSTHDLGLAEAHADRVVALHRGRVAAAGRIDALRATHDVDDLTGLYRSIVDTNGSRGAEGTNRQSGDGQSAGEAGSESGSKAGSAPGTESESDGGSGSDSGTVHVPGVSDR